MIRSSLHLKLVLFSIIAILLVSNIAGAIDKVDKLESLLDRLELLPPATGPTDAPPLQPVIAVAEWEPATGVLINYPLSIPMDLVVEMADDSEVMSVVKDRAQARQALSPYTTWRTPAVIIWCKRTCILTAICRWCRAHLRYTGRWQAAVTAPSP